MCIFHTKTGGCARVKGDLTNFRSRGYVVVSSKRNSNTPLGTHTKTKFFSLIEKAERSRIWQKLL